MSMGDSFKAVGDIKALSKLIPDNTGAMYKLSLIYYEVGQATESLTYVDRESLSPFEYFIVNNCKLLLLN